MPKIKDIQSDFRFIRLKIPKKLFETFELNYPELSTLYLERAYMCAIKNKEIFNTIFWSGLTLPKNELPSEV